MARKNRLFIPGLPHLIRLRGHNGAALVAEAADYPVLHDYLAAAAVRYQIELYGWSLAPQRILLLVNAPDKTALGQFIQYLGRRYVPYYNRRHHRRGALWESRYQCSPVDPQGYFLLVKKYIECQEDGALGEHSDGAQPAGQVAAHPLWLQLGPNPQQRQLSYRAFCQRPLNHGLVARIDQALDQNCLLAQPTLSRELESRLERPLQPRRSGRPRKYEPNPVAQWRWLEQQAERLLTQWGYQQIRLALMEREGLFAPHGPPVDGYGNLRGDGTTGCLRLLADGAALPDSPRLWYTGAMFSDSLYQPHIQEAHQIGVEAFGMAGVDIELEQLLLQARLYQALGLNSQVDLYLNSLGGSEALSRFRRALHDYYQPMAHLLDPEQRQWLAQRPERLIHHRDVLLQRLASGAPQRTQFIDEAASARLAALQHGLTAAGIAWNDDPQLFPINDYCQLVFEWRSVLDDQPLTLSRGGRYDSCASRVVGQPLAACGFAFKLEPIMRLLAHTQRHGYTPRQVDVVITACQPRSAGQALLLGRRLRQQFPQLSVVNDCSTQRLATRYANARRLGARFVIELQDDTPNLQLKDTRSQLSHAASLDTITDLLGAALLD